MRFFLMAFVIIILASNFALGAPDGYRVTVTPSVVEFQIIDPMGNITGYDPNTHAVIWNIPNTMYRRLTTPSADDTPPAKNEIYHRFEVQEYPLPVPISLGLHKVRLFGTAMLEQFKLRISVQYIPSISGATAATTIKNSVIYPNIIWTYEFDVPANPPVNRQLILVKVASSNDLITDINAANSVGHLGTPGTYQSLLSKAENAKAKLDAGQPVPAKNILNAFINEVTAQKGQQINANAADILIEDAQYIISHN